MRIAFFHFSCCFFFSVNAFATTGDELMVTASIVNVRAAPSVEAGSLIKLLKDRKVTEIQRQDNWVEIDTHREDIKTGWIHESLLAQATASKKHFFTNAF